MQLGIKNVWIFQYLEMETPGTSFTVRRLVLWTSFVIQNSPEPLGIERRERKWKIHKFESDSKKWQTSGRQTGREAEETVEMSLDTTQEFPPDWRKSWRWQNLTKFCIRRITAGTRPSTTDDKDDEKHNVRSVSEVRETRRHETVWFI